MKKCNTELMKELKAINNEIVELQTKARTFKEISYYENEEEPERNFDYEGFYKNLCDLQERELKIKGLLAKSNATTALLGMPELTISDGLTKLGQLTKKLCLLGEFKADKRIVRTLQHAKFEGDKDRIYISEKLYDVETIDKQIKETQTEICRLQVAIDRTNLINIIEY